MGGKKASSATSSTTFAPWQAEYGTAMYGAAQQHLDKYGFAGVPYQGPQVIPWTPEQMQRTQALQSFMQPVDFGPYRRAAYSNLGSQLRTNLIPNWQDRFAGMTGAYSGDFNRAMADATSERIAEMEMGLTGMEVQDAQRVKEAERFAFANMPAYMSMIDPEQGYRQAVETARYGEFMRQQDPNWMALMLGAVPQSASVGASSSWTKQPTWYDAMGVSFGESFGGAMGEGWGKALSPRL